MKKISYIGLFSVLFSATAACAGYDNEKFQDEIAEGLDLIQARTVLVEEPAIADGELGAEVYKVQGAISDPDSKMFIPTDMYIRMGGGFNLGFATDMAKHNNKEYKASGGYASQIGLGWNLSSYVRTEIDFQNTVLKFSDLDKHQATYNTIGGMLYFDFARRYVNMGDITYRRMFVPFMGIGAAFGAYEFEGSNGANGAVIAAPRATLGLNIAFNEIFGIDIAYQYQMMIGDGFGWDGTHGGVNNISNLMTTFRVNF